MVEEEGAALGGALQAAWCIARREGRRTARIGDFTGRIVAVKEETRCLPNKANVVRYRNLQAVQDQFSLSLRGVFSAQRKVTGA
jgi:xylulokinase